MTREQLREILDQVPEDAIIVPNDVMNLAVYRGDVNDVATWEWLGFIDFADDEYDAYDEGN